MAYSTTRWEITAFDLLTIPVQAALTPLVESGVTERNSDLAYGPYGDVPVGQYTCTRTWTTTAAAQSWLDGIDAIAASVGVTCLEKRLDS